MTNTQKKMGDSKFDEKSSSRGIGFLSSYLSDEINSESESTKTFPPPYQSNMTFDQNPPPYSPGLSSYEKNTSSHDENSSSYNMEPPPYASESTDDDGVNLPLTKRLYPEIPSAPSIDEIEYRIGLTEIERSHILTALSNMRANVLWKTQEEKKNFSLAEDEVIELLHDVESRLTNSEKEEFLTEIRKINKIRNDEKAKNHGLTQNEYQWRNNLVTIGLKIFEVALSVTVFVNLTESKRPFNRRIFVLFFELIGIISTCFLVYYWCDTNKSRNVRIMDCIFCAFSASGCAIAAYTFPLYGISIYTFSGMTIYGLDFLWKLYC